MTNKISYIFSIIRNIIDILLFIFNEISKENIFNEINNKNIIELLLEKNLIEIKNYSDINNETYYTKENLSKLIKTFCIYYWLFNSLFIFINEMNNKSLIVLDLSKENVLISLLHIYYYYHKKFPDEPPILKREILQYINFIISYNKKNNKENIISIKMKNIIETYMDKEILSINFKDIFSKSIKNENIINTNFIKNKKNENDISTIFNYLKINDIQFDMYLK